MAFSRLIISFRGDRVNKENTATLSLDTDPESEKLQIEGLRQMPPWRKVALVCDTNRTVRCLALGGLRQSSCSMPASS